MAVVSLEVGARVKFRDNDNPMSRSRGVGSVTAVVGTTATILGEDKKVYTRDASDVLPA